MSDQNADKNFSDQMSSKAKASDSAERKEDYMVLFLAALTVALVISGAVGPGFFKSLFF